MRKFLPILPMLLLLSSCSFFGTNPSPPSPTEQKFFNTVTNYVQVPVVVLHTNYIDQITPVIVLQTNQFGVPYNVTNTITIPVPQIFWQTNTAIQTNYTLTPNSTTAGTATTAGTVANLVVPGSGGIVTLGITLLAGVYGYLRSYKNGQTGNALSQEMETVGEFIKALPNGPTYWKGLTDFLAKHQADVGVVSQITSILKNDISNPDAKVAALQVASTIEALQTAAATPGAVAVPPPAPDPAIASAKVKLVSNLVSPAPVKVV